MTIRTRLVLWYAGLLTIIIIVFGSAIFMIMRASMISAIDRVLEETAAEVIRSIGPIPIGEFGPVTTRVRFRSEDVFYTPGVSIQVWEARDDGEGLVYTLVRSSADILDRKEPLDSESLRAAVNMFSDATINAMPERIMTRVFSAGELVYGVIQVAVPTQAIHQSARALLVVIVVASVLAILFAVILGLWLARQVLRPIEDITHAAASISTTDDLTTRLPWNGPMDELGRFTTVFNQLMARLEHLFKVQQRFVADVSHELRTPITAIRGNLEIIDRYGMDPVALEALHSESERMSRMINDLLLLARADYGGLEMDMYPLDLDTVVLEVYEQSQTLARTKKRQLHFALPRFEPVRLKGNADRLRQLLTNLMNNAIKFTPDGGTISLSLYQRDGFAQIEVNDTGIGIHAQDVPHIFERFYQANDARTHHSNEDGAGLGLSIVKWIVDSHDGQIDVQSEVGRGTIFTVKLPLMDVAANEECKKSTKSRLSRVMRLG